MMCVCVRAFDVWLFVVVVISGNEFITPNRSGKLDVTVCTRVAQTQLSRSGRQERKALIVIINTAICYNSFRSRKYPAK